MSQSTVGVISDTHGLLRPEAVEAFEGADLIIHAGDIGQIEVIDQLREVAPVYAVRGNVDRGTWAKDFPAIKTVRVGELLFYVCHDISQLDLVPHDAGVAAVVSGHSHRPSIENQNGVLYLNPGSAGPRRFSLPVTVARVEVSGRQMAPELIEVSVA
jgi:putative phosphoesterase